MCRIAKVMAHNERILEELLAARQHDRYRCGRVLLLLVVCMAYITSRQQQLYIASATMSCATF